MSDIEERLSTALGGAAASAPDATGLAGAARQRATARRRRTTLVSVAASVAVLAVVGGAVVLGSGGGGGTAQVASDGPSPSVSAAPATRVETWRDVSVSVPATWGYGPLSTWCTAGSTPGTPRVERPGGVVESIACSPQSGYGVKFVEFAKGVMPMQPSPAHASPDNGDFPADSWQGFQYLDGVGVLVVTATHDEAQAVLDSVQQVKTVDANGCAPQPRSEPYGAAADTVRLCRYGADGWLEQSETLTGDDAKKATEALDAAPSRPAMMCPNLAGDGFILVQSNDQTAEVRLGTCAGVFGWARPQSNLTADVLYWVLSPGWSGQLPDGITMDHPRP